MKSILFILLVALISLEARGESLSQEKEFLEVSKSGLGYSYEINEHFEPFVYLNNKLKDMKMDLKNLDLSGIGLDVGISGDFTKTFSYMLKYTSSQKFYSELKSFYQQYSIARDDTVENSKIYLGLNIRF